MTETGMSLGTPHYMSPEQAMGEREITARSDVYALGVVLYEMLTGDPPFTGSTAQAVVARVLTEATRPILPQRHTIPPEVEAAVLTALEKLPADRFATAAQIAEALNARTTGGTQITPRAEPVERGASVARWRIAAGVATLVALAALIFAGWGWRRSTTAAAPLTRTIVLLGDSTTPLTTVPSMALSPDGSVLVYRDAAPNRGLWLKRRDQLQAAPLPGTERATNPVFSPDGAWIAFVSAGRLKKVSVAGGTVVTIADSAAGGYGGAAWLDDGTLVFTAPRIDEFRRVGASGGAVTRAFRAASLGGRGFGMPVALPQSRGFLFQGCTSGCVTMGIYVVDLRTGKEKLLLPDAAHAQYVGHGRLLYVRRDGTVLLAPFDLDRLEVKGSGAPVADGVRVGNGYAVLAASTSGTLVYVRGSGNSAETLPVRVTAAGVATPIDTAWYGPLSSLALSPEGGRLAAGMGARDGDLNIWIKQLDRGPVTRLTFGGRDRRPAWSPDGRTIAFVRDTGTGSVIMARAADGSSADRVLARIPNQPQEIVWAGDGSWLVLRTDNAMPDAGDLIGVRTTGDTTPVPLVATPFAELTPAVSADGRWLAYASNESGNLELYVRPFPNTSSARWQVSVNGGSEPRWSRDGKTLYFLDGSKRMLAAHLKGGAEFAVMGVDPLFDASVFRLDDVHQSYDVTADGRFVFLSPGNELGAAATPRVVWVDGWGGR
jgi:serine/threonine-protein kinase